MAVYCKQMIDLDMRVPYTIKRKDNFYEKIDLCSKKRQKNRYL